MSEKERIDFNAPPELVEAADLVADLRGVTRTALLIEALEGRIEDVLTDETFREGVRSRYLRGDLEREAVVTLLGEAEAVRMDLLSGMLRQDPPGPAPAGELPTDEEFYGREPPTASPDDAVDGSSDVADGSSGG